MKMRPCVLLVSCRMFNDPSAALIREAYRAERLKPQIVLVEKLADERSLPELIKDGIISPGALSSLTERRELPQPGPSHQSSAFYVRFLSRRRGRKKR